MAAPTKEKSVCRLICSAMVLSLFYQSLGHEQEPKDEFLLCKQCGREITKAKDLINIGTPLAQRQRNDTILGQKGVLIQLFQNPQGHRFEVITSTTDADILKEKESHAEFSWFPNFAWRICLCPQCGAHLGWVFDPVSYSNPHRDDQRATSFVALILQNLLHKDYADSLLVIPKAYRS